MKRFKHILFLIVVALPMFVGMCFLTPNSVPATLNGGRGGNSLNSPKTGNDSGINASENGEEYVVTYKTYDDYFLDLNIKAETITEHDYTGVGSASDPLVVHSMKGFLFLTNYALSGISVANKYIELDCDIVLNEETFDKDGNPSGGDGYVYEWKPVTNFSNVFFDGNNHTIFGLFFDDMSTTKAALFNSSLKVAQNLRIENVYLKAKANVATLTTNGNKLTINNVYTKNGTIKGNHTLAGIATIANHVENSSNGVDIIQIETDTHYGWGHFAGIVHTSSGVNCINCDNYGNIEP